MCGVPWAGTTIRIARCLGGSYFVDELEQGDFNVSYLVAFKFFLDIK